MITIQASRITVLRVLAVCLAVFFLPISVFAAPVKVDIVDNNGKKVKTPTVDFSQHLFSFSPLITTGTLGTSAGTGQLVSIDAPKNTLAWTVSLAATNGPGSLWTDGINFYDYNDLSGPVDGVDTDVYGGQLTWLGGGSFQGDPAANCPTTNLSIASTTAFAEGSVDSVSILYTTNSGATKNCTWNYSSVSNNLSQIIPGTQPAGVYSLPMTLTIL